MIITSKETGILIRMMNKHLSTPLTEEKIKELRAGEIIYLSGIVFGARDAAHKRIIEAIEQGKKLPIDLKDATLFYTGPAPTPPGKKSGSIGPTTSARMDDLTEPLLKCGVRAMIGKGKRSGALKELLKKYKSVYLISVGGVSAFLSTKVKNIKVVAYADLGAEAIHEIEVEDLPLFVAYDIYGGDIFESALLVE